MKSGFHLSRDSLRDIAMTMHIVMAMIPEVEPSPKSSCSELFAATSPMVGGAIDVTCGMASNVKIVTILAITGVHAAAKNRRFEFKIALAIAVNP